MTPGPTIIRKCSACGGLIAQHTIRSGNTFGARFWTDGKRDAPMLPDQPLLVKCQHCGTLLWIDEQEKVGKIAPWGPRNRESKKFKGARPALTPTLQDYLDLLMTGGSGREKERYLRLRAWWTGNDNRRDSKHPAPMSDPEIANLRAFATLLDDNDDNDRIMKAEVMRELELFAEAEILLAKPFDKGLEQAVTIIRNLNRQGISAVKEMQFK
jgi:hypothetical protein